MNRNILLGVSVILFAIAAIFAYLRFDSFQKKINYWGNDIINGAWLGPNNANVSKLAYYSYIEGTITNVTFSNEKLALIFKNSFGSTINMDLNTAEIPSNSYKSENGNATKISKSDVISLLTVGTHFIMEGTAVDDQKTIDTITIIIK